VTNGRLHAYEVLLRVARVRELRASSVWAEASAEVLACQGRRDENDAARVAVAVASRVGRADDEGLDLARYELLSKLDAFLAEKEQIVAGELDTATQACLESANASVRAKRYREQVDGKVAETAEALEQQRTVVQQELAIENWLGSRKR
jgi:hypothetical protein